MKKIFIIILTAINLTAQGQQLFPIDTAHWDIKANNYILENIKGKDAIYLLNGQAWLKDFTFFNGTIEFDVLLTERASFPGVSFRAADQRNYEVFYLRSHLPGKPDANQAIPVVNGLTAWQLYFGPSYSTPYDYNYDDWTHIKIVVKDRKAQMFFDYSKKPHLSWNLTHDPKVGKVGISVSSNACHFANFSVDTSEPELIDFEVAENNPIEGIIEEWAISDKFEEKLLDDYNHIDAVINKRTWNNSIGVSEGRAANISKAIVRYDDKPGNTVFARIKFSSSTDQRKLFEFGYSDRVVVLLNGKPIYKGNNRWRSRDYRFLGTIGLFDAVYLDLKAGVNTLDFAVSEDFGGWLITGRFNNMKGIELLDNSIP